MIKVWYWDECGLMWSKFKLEATLRDLANRISGLVDLQLIKKFDLPPPTQKGYLWGPITSDRLVPDGRVIAQTSFLGQKAIIVLGARNRYQAHEMAVAAGVTPHYH